MWCVVVCSVVYWSMVVVGDTLMVVKVKASGHNVEGQGRCDGAERLRWCRVI